MVLNMLIANNLAKKTEELFKTHIMVIPVTLPGPYSHSFGSGQSSGQSSGGGPSGSSGGGGGPIRRRRSTTNPSFFLPQVTEFDPQLDEEDLDKELWTLLKNNHVPSSRQVFIMFHMSLKDKKMLRNTPPKNVYIMAKQVEKSSSEMVNKAEE